VVSFNIGGTMLAEFRGDVIGYWRHWIEEPWIPLVFVPLAALPLYAGIRCVLAARRSRP
jgi:hypothetical protein